MPEYVYVYIHPEYGYVYVGRTNNLRARIKTHDAGINDNISSDHMSLLRESSVYYVELCNKAEAISVEAYLINEHNPCLNIAINYNGDKSGIKMSLPHFIRMTDDERGIIFSAFKKNGDKVTYTPEQRAYFSQRTKDGLKAARARGRQGGRPKVGDERTKAAALAAYDANTLTNGEIAKQFGVSTATLSRWIKERKCKNEGAINAEPTFP